MESYRRQYVPPSAATSLAYSPRMGHTKDITVFLTGDTGMMADYVVGLIFAGAVALTFFFAWSIVLWIWMCMGHKRVGFLSGHPFVISNNDATTGSSNPKHSNNIKTKNKNGKGGGRGATKKQVDEDHVLGDDDLQFDDDLHFEMVNALDDNDVHVWTPDMERPTTPATPRIMFSDSGEEEEILNESMDSQKGRTRALVARRNAQKRRHLLVRLLFVLAGMCFIVFSMLMMTQGVANLQATIDTLHGSAGDVYSIASEVEQIHSDNLVNLLRNEQGVDLRDVLVEEFGDANRFCPNDPTLEQSGEIRDAAQLAREAAGVLEELGNMLNEETGRVLEFTESVRLASTKVREVTNISLTDWKVLVLLIPCIIVPTLLMFGVFLAIMDQSIPAYECIQTWVVTPIFVLMVIVACIAQGGLAIGAGMNSDFCLPSELYDNSNAKISSSPDTTMRTILKRTGFEPDSYVYNGVDWYISQCDSLLDNPFQPLLDYEPILLHSQEKLRQLDDLLFQDEAFSVELTAVCGRDFDDLREHASSMRKLVGKLQDTLARTLLLFSCGNIVGIYTTTVYDATCTYSPEAFFWIYCSTLVLALSGMVMLTLRSSYKLTRDDCRNHYDVDGCDGNDAPHAKSHRLANSSKQSDGVLDEMDEREMFPDNDIVDEVEGCIHYDHDSVASSISHSILPEMLSDHQNKDGTR